MLKYFNNLYCVLSWYPQGIFRVSSGYLQGEGCVCYLQKWVQLVKRYPLARFKRS